MMSRAFKFDLIILIACVFSKLSLWEFRNKGYSSKVCAYLPLFWSLGKSDDPLLRDLQNEIGRRIARDVAMPETQAPHGDCVARGGRTHPNVLMLVVESLRSDAINPEVAPFLDSLGRKSLFFENHYSSANCTPYSLFSLLTAQWPSRYQSYLAAGGEPACFKMFPGYNFFTANSVSWSFWNQDRTLFSKFQTLDCRSRSDAQPSDSGMIDNFFRRVSSVPARPFFGLLMLNSTHFGYTVDPNRIIRPGYFRNAFDMRTASSEWMGPIKDRYLNSVHLIDAGVRRAFEKLDSLGLSENTVVVIVGDHGEEFMETGKFTHSSEANRYQTHVPLIIHYRNFQNDFHGFSSHVQMNFFLEELLSEKNPLDILRTIGGSLASVALAFNSIPLPDDADEFGTIGNDFELRMRWDRAHLEVYDARFADPRRRLQPREMDAIAAAIRNAWNGRLSGPLSQAALRD